MALNTLITNLIHEVHTISMTLLATYFYLRILTPKDSIKRKSWVCYFVSGFTAFITNFMVVQYSTSSSFQFFIILGFPILLCFKNKISDRLSMYFLLCIIEFFTESFASSIFTTINIFIPERDFSPRSLAQNGEVIPTIVCHLILALSFFILCHLIGSLIEQYFQYIEKKTLLFLSVPFLFIFAHHNMLIIAPIKYIVFSSILLWIIFFIMLTFLLYGMKHFEQQEYEHLKKENQKIQLLEQAKHYETLYLETLKQRRWAHDLSNHLSTINYLLDHQHLKESNTYINTVIDFTTEIFKENEINEN